MNDSSILFALSLISSICNVLEASSITEYILPELALLYTTGSVEVLQALPGVLVSLASSLKNSGQHAVVDLYLQQLENVLWILRKSAITQLPDLLTHVEKEEQTRFLPLISSLCHDKFDVFLNIKVDPNGYEWPQNKR